MVIGSVELQANIRFRKMDGFQGYANAIEVDYDSENVNFNGFVYKLKTLSFKVVKQNVYAKSAN